MRIDDSSRLQFDKTTVIKRGDTQTQKDSSGSITGTAQRADDPSRSDRIEQLKQALAQGKPIDVGRLADKLLQTGMFIDEKA